MRSFPWRTLNLCNTKRQHYSFLCQTITDCPNYVLNIDLGMQINRWLTNDLWNRRSQRQAGRSDAIFILNVNSAYWKIKVQGRYKDKTELAFNEWPLKLISMPIELYRAPAAFLRTMDVILSPDRRQFALVCVDNKVVFSRDYVKLIPQIRIMLSVWQRARFSFIFKKGKFSKAKTD